MRTFEGSYAYLRSARNTRTGNEVNKYQEEFKAFTKLLPGYLEEEGVTYSAYIKGELEALASKAENNNPCGLNLSSEFINTAYADRRLKLLFLFGFLFLFDKQPDTYIADSLIKLGAKILEGDKELNTPLMIGIFELLCLSQIKESDIDGAFGLIDKALDLSEDDFERDFLWRISPLIGKYYTSKYKGVLEKGVKYPDDSVREFFIEERERLIGEGRY